MEMKEDNDLPLGKLVRERSYKLSSSDVGVTLSLGIIDSRLTPHRPDHARRTVMIIPEPFNSGWHGNPIRQRVWKTAWK